MYVVCVFVCLRLCTCVWVYVCVCVCECVCVRVCVYICIYEFGKPDANSSHSSDRRKKIEKVRYPVQYCLLQLYTAETQFVHSRNLVCTLSLYTTAGTQFVHSRN